MSDLISRKSLMEHIEREYRQWGEDYDVEQILGDIEDFPTAFDLDKVIAELEKMIDPNVDSETGIPCDNWVVDMQNEIIKKCIEIVQKGGIHNPHSGDAEPPKTD